MSSLKQRYDKKQTSVLASVTSSIIKATEDSIDKGSVLPFYISNINLTKNSYECLEELLLKKHGIVIAKYPSGIMVTGLVEVEEC